MTDNIIIDFGMITSIIMFVSQMLKYRFNVKTKYIPIINVILGCVLGWLVPGQFDIVQGIVIGLSASGIYDVCNKTFGVGEKK